MISLKPREQFKIVRQLADHTDATTYYVRAVIRNSVSGAIIETLNLTDETNGRFTKLWEVPSDVSGEGFYIDITLSVYSDSGYTTKASSYGDSNEQYLVYDRRPPSVGGGGVDVDYKKIEKILALALKPLADRKELDLAPVLLQIKGVLGKVEAIKIPNPEKLDQTPVLLRLTSVEKTIVKAIDNKPVTPVTELSGLEKNITDAITKKEPNLEKVYKLFSDLSKLITDHVTEYSSREGAKEKLAEIKEALGGVFRGEDFKPKPVERGKDPRIMRLFGQKNEK